MAIGTRFLLCCLLVSLRVALRILVLFPPELQYFFPHGVSGHLSDLGPSTTKLLNGNVIDFSSVCEDHAEAEIALVGRGHCPMQNQLDTAWIQHSLAAIVSESAITQFQGSSKLPLIVVKEEAFETIQHYGAMHEVIVAIHFETPVRRPPLWEFRVTNDNAQKLIEALSAFSNEEVILIPHIGEESQVNPALFCLSMLTHKSTSRFWDYMKRLYSPECSEEFPLCESALEQISVTHASIDECTARMKYPRIPGDFSELRINGKAYEQTIENSHTALCFSFLNTPEQCRDEVCGTCNGDDCDPACSPSRLLRASMGGSSGGSSGSSYSSSSSNYCKSRECAIGVGVSSGGIALILCGFYGYTYLKRYNKKRNEERNTDLALLSVPAVGYSSGHQVYGFSECPICISDLQTGAQVKVTHCDHIFHAACFDDWIRSCASNPRCPECNRNPFIAISNRKELDETLIMLSPGGVQSSGEAKETYS